MNAQLPLGLRLPGSASFGNFFAGPNRTAFESVREYAGCGEYPLVYLWGAPTTGKTHLLQAACHEAANDGISTAYVPLSYAADLTVEVLEGLESLELVCLDDVDAVAGDEAWESALFSLFNRLREAESRLIVSSKAAPGDTGLQLPDLVSRLSWGPVFHLALLSDEEKLQAIALHAEALGLQLPEETGRYLLRRFPRDLAALCELIDRLDQASLAAQRRLTVPFVKEMME